MMNELKRLEDFFFVYFDKKTSRRVANHPSEAIPLLREAIAGGLSSPERVQVYAAALRDAIAVQEVATKKALKPAR